MSKEKTNLLLKISAEVKRYFKAYCAKQGRTMTEVVEEMMKEKMKKG